MTFLIPRIISYNSATQLQGARGWVATLSYMRRSVCNVELRITYFEAEVLTQTDYSSFGVTMADRQSSAGAEGYRYGFNGMERDDEV